MKKLISLMLAMAIVLGGGVPKEVQAADESECVDGSYLLMEDSSTGYAGAMTRGVYLRSGSSSLVKEGTGKISAGGDTTGQKIVNNISVTVKVQRLVNGNWQYYTTWSADKTNAAYVSTSKVLTVPTGYYYRVCCTHHANSDTAFSSTDGIYI